MIPTMNLTFPSRGRLRSVAALVVSLLACLTTPAAYAAVTTIFDSVGFEPPKFSTTFASGQYIGQLEGQVPFNEPFPIGTWKQTKPIGVYDSKATVVGNVPVPPASGLQSVKVTRAAFTDTFWSVTDTGWPSERYICIDWDMLVQAAATPSGSFGPYFGVEAYDDDNNPTSLGLLASFGVDAATGEILYRQQTTAFLVAPGPVVAFDAWNHFTILLDYLDHDFDLYLNGVFVANDGFVDHSLGNPLDEFTDAPIAALAAGGDPFSQAATGTAYFDNYKVIQSDTNPCIPEPGTCLLGLLGASVLAASGRARRHGA